MNSLNTQKLWTKNFTIITLGTLVSMCGVVVLSFSSSLLILDQTGSTLLYALFLALINIPAIIVPLLIGPVLDKYSRRNLIIILDYTSAVISAICAVGIFLDIFPTWSFYLFGAIFGGIGGAYNVTYESFYPSMITPGFETKAYSVSSLLYPIASTMFLPLSAILYEALGLPFLFAFTSIAYFIAATFETRIKVKEAHLEARKQKEKDEKVKKSGFVEDFKQGMKYLKQEKGLMAVTCYFFILFFADGVATTLTLPFFKHTPGYTVLQYSIIMGISTLGRFCGGLFNYNHKFKPNNRFKIASFVYLSLGVIHSVAFFFNVYIMGATFFVLGALSVTSFNIRTSSTQAYVKDEIRGRYNGVFIMFTMFGSILGQLFAGFFGEAFPIKYLVFAVMMLYVIGYFLFILPKAKHVKIIYNNSFTS